MAKKNRPKSIIPDLVDDDPNEQYKRDLRDRLHGNKKKSSKYKVHIDWEQFEKLCYIQCTRQEIADFFGLHPDHLAERCREELGLTYKQAWDRMSVNGRMSLRRELYQKAIKERNLQAMIWLSKNYLGMKEPLRKVEDDAPEDQHKEIIYKPTIMGKENVSRDDLQKWMEEFMDKPREIDNKNES